LLLIADFNFLNLVFDNLCTSEEMVDKLVSLCGLIVDEGDERILVEGLSLNEFLFFLLLPLVVLVVVLLIFETHSVSSASLSPPKSDSNTCWSEIPFKISEISFYDTCAIFIQML